MATDRQTPCDKYKPRAKVRYKNQKKQELEKIRKEERY